MDLYEGSESSSDYDEPDEEQKLLRHEVRVNGQRHATPQQFAHSHSGAAFSGDTHETDPNDKLGRCWCKCRSHDKHKHRDSAGSGHRCERGVCHSRCCGCFCRNTWKQNLCSVAVGSLVGVAVFWGTTCALYAISVNAVASIVCGCTLLAISCVVAVRAANPFNDFSDTAKLFTLAFSIVLFLAAIFCLLLDKKVILMAKMVKVPLYTVVNIALTFAITFPFSGLLHAISFDYLFCGSAKCCCCCRRFCCCCRRAVAKDSNALAADEINRRPNSQQTCTMFTASVVLGLYYGIVFGLLDIEDAVPASREGQILEEALIATKTAEAHTLALDRAYSLPIGVAVGAVAALMYTSQRRLARSGPHEGDTPLKHFDRV